MKTDDLLRKQLTARLKRLRSRAAALNAEVELVEQLLADNERLSVRASTRLRRNSVARLTVQAQVRRHLADKGAPVRAQHLFETLQHDNPALKSSTFRSHLKRMVDAGIIKREGSRGHYKLAAEVPIDEPKETIRTWRPRFRTYYR